MDRDPERVRRIIAEKARAPASAAHDDARLVEDLGLDSLALADLVTLIQLEFGLEPQDDLAELLALETVGEAVQFVAGARGSAATPHRVDTRALLRSLAGSILGLAATDLPDVHERDLYELGFDSLSLFRLRAQLAQEIQVALEIDELFDASTLGELADLVERRRWARQPRGGPWS